MLYSLFALRAEHPGSLRPLARERETPHVRYQMAS